GKSKDLDESCALLGSIDLIEERGYEHMLYRVAGELAKEEGKEGDQRSASILFREFIRVQEAGSPLLFNGVVQMVLTQLSLALLTEKCAPLAAALELFREVTTQMGFSSWTKDGRKCLFLGHILHLRYMRTELSNDVLQEASTVIKSIMDLIPNQNSHTFSSLETVVVSALITLARSLHTVDWINSMKLFREVIVSSLKFPRDLWDRFNGIYPFHHTINNKAQCLINSGDILNNIIKDISTPSYSLTLIFQIYLNSLRSESALISAPRVEGACGRSDYTYQDSVFKYCGTRRLRTDHTGSIAHGCYFRYILLDSGDPREQWPDKITLSPPFMGYEAYEVILPLGNFLDISYNKIASVLTEHLAMPISARASEALTIDFIATSKQTHKEWQDVHWSPQDVLLENRLQKLKDSSEFGLTNILQTLLYRGPERALEVVEKSRSQFWSRLMRLRADFSDLPPELGKKLETVAEELEKCKGQRERGASKEDAKLQLALESKFNALVGQARKIPGFENFLLPKTYDTLVAATAQGPIVFLLADKDTSAALIVSTTGVDAISLELTSANLAKMFRVLSKAQKEGRRSPYDVHLRLLWNYIVRPVLEKLNLLQPPPDKRPRLWWCPSGPFSFFPIHAAGTGFGTTDAQFASDYILSSYIPSVEALINVRQEMYSLPLASELQALIVAQPETPGHTSLPKTAKELEMIQSLVPPKQLLRIGNLLETSEESLLATNANRNVEDVKDPLNSGFELTNGRLTLSTLTSCHTPKAFLAYLSACESAANDQELPDESLNLAAAMLYTGFKSVVGTMWSMIARTIYEELFRHGDLKLNARTIPEALDFATRQLRAKGIPAIRWATYIHVGM
ncbi:hypothetical protein BDQ17DRAFT_1371007, partial [Cyathus striatus]